MLPFYKLFSLVLRVFSRPIINYTKRVHLNSNASQSEKLRRFFIWIGNFYHRTEIKVNRRFLKIESEIAHKPLNDQLAVQKGIDFTFEVFFYIIVIGLPIYQLVRGSNEAKEKSQKLEERLKNIEKKLQFLTAQKQAQAKEKNQYKQYLRSNNRFEQNNKNDKFVQQLPINGHKSEDKLIDKNVVYANWNQMVLLNTRIIYLKQQKMLENYSNSNQMSVKLQWMPMKNWIQNLMKNNYSLI